jgi:hypothetical protein
MLKFKEFLNESEELHIDLDVEFMLQHLDNLNDALEAVTENSFPNSAIFMNAVRGTLERFGVILPSNYVMPMLSQEAETVYTLGESNMYLYIVHNLQDGLVEGYAQVVNQDELDDLMEMNGFESDDEEDVDAAKREWIPPDRRKSSDDSGNTDEYA